MNLFFTALDGDKVYEGDFIELIDFDDGSIVMDGIQIFELMKKFTLERVSEINLNSVLLDNGYVYPNSAIKCKLIKPVTILNDEELRVGDSVMLKDMKIGEKYGNNIDGMNSKIMYIQEMLSGIVTIDKIDGVNVYFEECNYHFVYDTDMIAYKL